MGHLALVSLDCIEFARANWLSEGFTAVAVKVVPSNCLPHIGVSTMAEERDHNDYGDRYT